MRDRWPLTVLGAVWLPDGLLQPRPVMFTHAFVDQIIAPAAQGQPGLVAGPINRSALLMGSDIAAFNAPFARG